MKRLLVVLCVLGSVAFGQRLGVGILGPYGYIGGEVAFPFVTLGQDSDVGVGLGYGVGANGFTNLTLLLSGRMSLGGIIVGGHVGPVAVVSNNSFGVAAAGGLTLGWGSLNSNFFEGGLMAYLSTSQGGFQVRFSPIVGGVRRWSNE